MAVRGKIASVDVVGEGEDLPKATGAFWANVYWFVEIAIRHRIGAQIAIWIS
jgi:hypothetical protein